MGVSSGDCISVLFLIVLCCQLLSSYAAPAIQETPTGGYTGVPLYFYVQCDAPSDVVTVSMGSVTLTEAETQYGVISEPIPNARYTVKFIPFVVGAQSLVVKVNGVAVAGSPISFNALVGPISAVHSLVVGIVPTWTAGSASTFSIQAKDIWGNPSSGTNNPQHLPTDFVVTLTSLEQPNAETESVNGAVSSITTGSFSVVVTPFITGPHVLTVLWGGEPIPQTWPVIEVVHAAANAQASRVTNMPTSGVVDVQFTFQVTIRDQYDNLVNDGGLSVTMMAEPSSAYIDFGLSTFVYNGFGVYTGMVTPILPGALTLEVFVNGNQVPATWGEILIVPGTAVSGSITDGDFVNPTAGVGCPFRVNAYDSRSNLAAGYAQLLSVLVQHQASGVQFAPPIDSSFTGVQLVNWLPTKAGSTEVRLLLGNVIQDTLTITVDTGATSAANSYAYVTSTEGRVGFVSTFVIVPMDAYGNAATATSTAPDEFMANIVCSPNPLPTPVATVGAFDPVSKTYTGWWTPIRTGDCRLYVNLLGAAVPVTVHTVSVIPGITSGGTSEVTGVPNSVIAGVPFSIFVQSIDGFSNTGNMVSTNGDLWDAVIALQTPADFGSPFIYTPPTSPPVSGFVFVLKNGGLRIDFSGLNVTGVWALSVFFNGTAVPVTWSDVTVFPAKTSPATTAIFGVPAYINKNNLTTWLLVPKDQFGNLANPSSTTTDCYTLQIHGPYKPRTNGTKPRDAHPVGISMIQQFDSPGCQVEFTAGVWGLNQLNRLPTTGFYQDTPTLTIDDSQFRSTIVFQKPFGSPNLQTPPSPNHHREDRHNYDHGVEGDGEGDGEVEPLFVDVGTRAYDSTSQFARLQQSHHLFQGVKRRDVVIWTPFQISGKIQHTFPKVTAGWVSVVGDGTFRAYWYPYDDDVQHQHPSGEYFIDAFLNNQRITTSRPSILVSKRRWHFSERGHGRDHGDGHHH